MSFGGSRTPEAEGPQDTEQGRALFEVSRAELERYRGTGQRVEDEYIGRQQERFDSRGRAKLDPSAARTANEKAFTVDPGSVDPNQLGSLAEVGREGASAGSETEAQLLGDQQERAQQGIVGAAAIGVGRTPGLLRSNAELAADAQADANQAAQESANSAAADRYVAGSVLGGLAGIPLSRYKKKEPSNLSPGDDVGRLGGTF